MKVVGAVLCAAVTLLAGLLLLCVEVMSWADDLLDEDA